MYKDYNNNQLSLAVNLDFTLDENHLVTVLNQFIESIPLADIMDTMADTGRPPYDPRMMMKILLFALCTSNFFGSIDSTDVC